MAKNILVIAGSPRKNGNTEILADAFIKGAQSSGNIVAKFSLHDKKINGCLDCKYCYKHNGECLLKDDMNEIYEAMKTANIIVFASPVYFYGFTS